jgi:drug/metabolite transporter (DMT)-like permease
LVLADMPAICTNAGRPGLQLLRSAFLLVTTAFFFFGLKFLGLATMSAIMFVTPLLVTLLSMPILGERVGWRRITSVLVGFAGALIIIRPGSDAIGLAALLPLTAALFNAAYHLATRVLSRTDAALTTVGYTAIVGAVMSNFALLGGWVTPDAAGWAMLVGLGLIGCLGHFALNQGLQSRQCGGRGPLRLHVPDLGDPVRAGAVR